MFPHGSHLTFVKCWIKGIYSFLNQLPTHITPTSCPVRLRSHTRSKIAIFCVRRRCAGYETIRHSSGISVLIHIRVTRGRSGKSVSVRVHVTVDAWRFENTTAWRVSVTVKRWRCHRWVVIRLDARRVNVALFLIYWRRLTRLSSGMWLWAWRSELQDKITEKITKGQNTSISQLQPRLSLWSWWILWTNWKVFNPKIHRFQTDDGEYNLGGILS